MPRELINDDRDFWDQQPDESKLWFDRFDIYRLIGPGRSISKAFRKYRLITRGIGSGVRAENHWYDASKEWKWEERATAWDDAMRGERDDEAYEVFNTGYALPHVRIDKLSLVAKRLEDFILDPKTTRISPFVIDQYRGILDDIAKERGERQKETRITGPAGGPIVIETSWGRGNAANERWKTLEGPKDPVIETIVEEVSNDDA